MTAKVRKVFQQEPAQIGDGFFRPSRRSEADIAAAFAHRIMSDGRLRIHLEVLLPSSCHRSGAFRADALVTLPTEMGDRVVCAIEFKRDGKAATEGGRQRFAYQRLGVPVFYCEGFSAIEATVAGVFARAAMLWGMVESEAPRTSFAASPGSA